MNTKKDVRGVKAGTSTLTEYEVREIDAYGDAQGVECFDTEAEAREFAADADLADPNSVAVVIEKHSSPYSEARGRYGRSKYETLATFGDAKALALWSGDAALANASATAGPGAESVASAEPSREGGAR